MFTLQTITSILAFLSFSVLAFPLSLRDVVAPKIIKPDGSSVWIIGTQQIVSWETTNFPAQVTNPIGKVILGFNESDSMNLDLDHPLAQNFQLTDGSVTITVPNVPPKNNYLIVLMGDSGDSSEPFAISPMPFPVSGVLTSSASSASIDGSTLPTSSLSISSSVTTPTSTDITSAAVDTPAALPPTGTTTAGSTSSSSSSSSSSGSVSDSASALAASSTSAGWSLHHRGSSVWNSAAPFLMSVAPFVMVFMA